MGEFPGLDLLDHCGGEFVDFLLTLTKIQGFDACKMHDGHESSRGQVGEFTGCGDGMEMGHQLLFSNSCEEFSQSLR